MKIDGEYKIAIVNFLTGKKGRGYAFALFDDAICIGDKVLCDSNGTYAIAEVTDIKENAGDYNVTKEIICKLDFSSFMKRKKKRERKKHLQDRMDKLVREYKSLDLYKLIAEQTNDEIMKKMLEEYEAL